MTLLNCQEHQRDRSIIILIPKDELLNTLSIILDDNYEVLKTKMDPDMNSVMRSFFI